MVGTKVGRLGVAPAFFMGFFYRASGAAMVRRVRVEAGVLGGQVGRAVQVKRPRKDSWTVTRRREFLENLAATCNVTWSAEAAGMHVISAYKLRMRDAAFRAAWGEALEQGYARLETMLLERASPMIETPEISGDRIVLDAASMDIDLAFKLLQHHRAAVKGGRPHHDRQGKATQEETDAAIIRKLTTLRKRLDADG